MRVTFGPFALDLDSRRLLRGSEDVHLLPKAFELLTALVESRPRALSKSELQERLWPSTFVVEANLSNLVSELRAALGETPQHPRFIRTVHGFGYAFAGDAADTGTGPKTMDAAAPPMDARKTLACWIVWQRKDFRLAAGPNLIGRDPDATVRIDLPSVSRRHARILVEGSDAVLEDLGSKNGTFLRGKRSAAASRLQDGDEIQVGSARLTFRTRSIGSTETQAL